MGGIQGAKCFVVAVHGSDGYDLIVRHGISMMFGGRLGGDGIMESMDPAVSLRFIWDAADPRAITWKNEIGRKTGPGGSSGSTSSGRRSRL